VLASRLNRLRLSHSLRYQGLTLLELLVVLVILAIVATVAVNSLQPRVEAARFEQTRKQMSNVQDAALGPVNSRQADGTPLVSGFVADIGRLPIHQISVSHSTVSGDSNASTEGIELCELWDIQSQLALSYPFQFRSGPSSPVNYSDVQIPCGWRGPYLQLPMGVSSLRDPWNRVFEIQANEDFEIESLIWNPVAPYDQVLASDLKTGKVSVTGAINFGQTAPPNLEVVMLVPDPESSRTELVVLTDEDSNPSTFSFTQVPVGLRAICVMAQNQRLLTKYVNVPHQGLSLVFDLSTNSSTNQSADEESDE
jgi:prepilin-type N-terminal cleavage/methylation domain-containing protein